jgi:hypothetical protein
MDKPILTVDQVREKYGNRRIMELTAAEREERLLDLGFEPISDEQRELNLISLELYR